MNYHGFITPATAVEAPSRSVVQRIGDWLRQRGALLVFVILPTLAAAIYLYGFAADQYVTQANFVIESPDSHTTPMGVGDILGMGAPVMPAQSQAMGVSEYLQSQQVVDMLQSQLSIVNMFRRPEADFFSELRPASPSPERLRDYYNSMVKAQFSKDTGISKLEVHAFRPEDSYAISMRLLDFGERRVNDLNKRSYGDAVSQSQRQLAEAEANARDIEVKMTAYRQNNADVDPTSSGEAQTTLLTKQQGDLASAKSQLQVMGAMVSRSSPQYRAMAERVASLETQVAAQKSQLTGSGSTVASRLGGYEDLKVRQEFAAKRYESAAAALEKAREQASRQSLYVVRIVDPVMPVRALYPKRGVILLTLFLSLLVAYGI